MQDGDARQFGHDMNGVLSENKALRRLLRELAEFYATFDDDGIKAKGMLELLKRAKPPRDQKLAALVKRAVDAFNALPPERQEQMLNEQRESFVRGNVELDRMEREERMTRRKQ